MTRFDPLDATDLRIAQFVQMLEPSLSIQTLRERSEEMALLGIHCVGVFDAEQLLGLACYSCRVHFFSGRVLYVENVVFLPESRGLKLGSQLMRWLETQALAMGCNKVTLDAYARNTRARSFYEREGYDPRGVHFVKDLT